MIAFISAILSIISIIGAIRLYKCLPPDRRQKSLRFTLFTAALIVLFVFLQNKLFPYTPPPIDSNRWIEIAQAKPQAFIDNKSIVQLDDGVYQYDVLTNQINSRTSSSSTYVLNCNTKIYTHSTEYISYSQPNANGYTTIKDFSNELPVRVSSLTLPFNTEQEDKAFIFNLLCLSFTDNQQLKLDSYP